MNGTAPGGVWPDRIRDQLAQVVDEGRWRHPRTFDARGPVGTLDGHRVVSFASNDYLGLSAHPAVVAAAHEAVERYGAGAGASRLVTGSRPVHAELERALAAWKGTEGAVCFPTGFAANLGVLSTLGGPGVRVLSDELNHASIIDGCRLSRSALAVYRHRDLTHLEELLVGGTGTPTLVVTDTVFSMDGDAAPLDELVPLCARHGALLVLDEAHAVLGPHLRRDPRRHHRPRRHAVQDAGRARGLRRRRPRRRRPPGQPRPPLHLLDRAPAGRRRGRVGRLARRALRRGGRPGGPPRRPGDRLAEAGLVPPGHRSPIVPVVLGPEQAALDASAALLEEGLWVPAIRPPTVPAGTSRLRVTLSAAHTDEDVSRLLDALLRLPGAYGPPVSASATR